MGNLLGELRAFFEEGCVLIEMGLNCPAHLILNWHLVPLFEEEHLPEVESWDSEPL